VEELFLLLLFLSFSLKSFLKGLIEDSDIRGGSRKKYLGGLVPHHLGGNND